MELLAICSHLLRVVAAGLAIYFCVRLFRGRRETGWLLVGAVFIEPFYLMLMRVLRGGSLLAYEATSLGSDGVMDVSYRIDFPVLYLIAVAGLFLLGRASERKSSPQ